jgi:oligopeptide transport system ATP-binding protein
METKQTKVIEVKDLALSFYTDKGRVKALRGVSFDLYKGEILCIVGESGSGKSVTAKTIMGILPGNGRIDGGAVMYQGEDLTRVSEEDFHRIRGNKIGMIFQDPLSSLNPIMRVGRQITEAMLINGNKLKRMFEDIISPTLIKHKNNEALLVFRIEEAKKRRDDVLEANKNKIKEVRENKSLHGDEKKNEIAKMRNQNKAAHALFKTERTQLKDEFKPILAQGKLEIKEKSKEAKLIVAKYKVEIKQKHDQQVAPLKNQLKATSDPSEQNKIKEAISQADFEYQDALKLSKAEAKRQAIKVMTEVGIPNAPRRFKQYPFEFSGGMRQRIVIAIALTQNPDILILDEPTTALDVTIQAQILELVNRLKESRQLSCIFITHDLGVVANMADRVAVMYAGKIVEFGTAHEIFYDPRHPYTWALLSSIPDIDSHERLEAIPGTPPNMIYPPKGDAFAIRSRYAMAIDFKEEPPFFKISDTHYAATWLLDPRAPKAEMPKIVSERINHSLAKAGKTDGK